MSVYEVTLKVHIYTDPAPTKAVALEHVLAQLQAVQLTEAEYVVNEIEFIAAEEGDGEEEAS